MYVHCEHVLRVIHSIDKEEEEEEEATDIKCRIKTAAPCYWEEDDVILDHRAREKKKRKKKKNEILIFVYDYLMTRHVRNVCSIEYLGMVRKVSNERLK
jgi:hypothetical protein